MRIQYNPHRTCVSRISFPLVKSKTSRKVKSEKSSRKPVTTFDVRSREWRRGTHALFLTSCVERVLLYPPCARAHHARRALRTLRPHTPPTPRHVPTARRAHRDHSTHSHRDHSTAHALSCSNRTRCHSVTRGVHNDSRRRAGSAMPGATHAHGRDADHICTPHMHTTHVHQTGSPRSGERDTTSPNRCPASRRACATCNLDTK